MSKSNHDAQPASGERVFIKPAASARVRDPADSQVIPADGKPVTWGPFWDRRRADGDIHLAEPPADAPAPAPPAPSRPAAGSKE